MYNNFSTTNGFGCARGEYVRWGYSARLTSPSKNILRRSSLAALPQLLSLSVARLTYTDINLEGGWGVKINPPAAL